MVTCSRVEVTLIRFLKLQMVSFKIFPLETLSRYLGNLEIKQFPCKVVLLGRTVNGKTLTSIYKHNITIFFLASVFPLTILSFILALCKHPFLNFARTKGSPSVNSRVFHILFHIFSFFFWPAHSDDFPCKEMHMGFNTFLKQLESF